MAKYGALNEFRAKFVQGFNTIFMSDEGTRQEVQS